VSSLFHCEDDEGRTSDGGVVVSTNAIPVAYRLSHGGVDGRGEREDKVIEWDLLECSMFY
jgi:hypothetical protein